MQTKVENLKVGNMIMPPAREVQIWMRRAAQERNLPESALLLTITSIEEGTPDKRGRWLIICADNTPEWNADRARPTPFRFRARPETPWPVHNTSSTGRI
jgi:hypothetical protein